MYFQGLTNVNEIKAEYRRLCFLHHPDIGGDTATMQAINAAYHLALEQANGQTSEGFDGKDHTYYYNPDVEQAVMDKINEILAAQLPNVTLELVGTWLWLDGDTKPVKDQLGKNGLKLRWNNYRKKWCWHPGKWRGRKSKASFNDLREMYGAKTYSNQVNEREAIAA